MGLGYGFVVECHLTNLEQKKFQSPEADKALSAAMTLVDYVSE